MIGGQRYESAWGRSKKEAEQRAAELTYLTLAGPLGTPQESGF